eukprot:TRINITY_DN12149_c0_g1_i1.p1 TRINITY_DN12149_c0_g1~~TRINITY_DN12149_c0_g1_i1.p1  ORF type:complete len:332 (+),score=58.57 TRINITY_DN12149_c0_g1_i1:70-996(+)
MATLVRSVLSRGRSLGPVRLKNTALSALRMAAPECNPFLQSPLLSRRSKASLAPNVDWNVYQDLRADLRCKDATIEKKDATIEKKDAFIEKLLQDKVAAVEKAHDNRMMLLSMKTDYMDAKIKHSEYGSRILMEVSHATYAKIEFGASRIEDVRLTKKFKTWKANFSKDYPELHAKLMARDKKKSGFLGVRHFLNHELIRKARPEALTSGSNDDHNALMIKYNLSEQDMLEMAADSYRLLSRVPHRFENDTEGITLTSDYPSLHQVGDFECYGPTRAVCLTLHLNHVASHFWSGLVRLPAKLLEGKPE